jgi:hypothetical protein
MRRVEEDEDRVLRDGERFRVPLIAMDAAQQTVAAHKVG